MKTTSKYVNRIGRILFSLIFIASGLSKIPDWNTTIQYMEAHHMVFTTFFLVAAILFQVLGGFAVLLGKQTKKGTLLLLIFLIPATFIFHSFWLLPTENIIEIMAQKQEMTSFLKNITIIGALILIYSQEEQKTTITMP